MRLAADPVVAGLVEVGAANRSSRASRISSHAFLSPPVTAFRDLEPHITEPTAASVWDAAPTTII